MNNIVCFGEVLWDVFPEHKKIGGAPLNVAIRLQSLGNKVSMISRVGNDNDGKRIIDFIKDNGVNTTYIQQDNELETGKVNVTLDNEGSASYEIKYPTAWDKITVDNSLINEIQNTDAFVFGSLIARDEVSRNTLFDLLKIAKYKIFDINLRKPHYSYAVLNNLMQYADFIKFNDDEILEIVKESTNASCSIKEAISYISKTTHTKSICVTKGSKGAILYFNGEFYENDGYKVTVVDTVGAGDSFLASLINQLLKDTAPQKAIDFACAVGALVASREGANPKIDTKQINDLMKQ